MKCGTASAELRTTGGIAPLRPAGPRSALCGWRWPVLALLGCALAGCQAPAFLLSNVLPRPKIPAAHELADQPTLVVVDDPNRVLPSYQEAGLLASSLGRALVDQKVVTTMIPASKVDELRLAEPEFSSWAIDRIGRQAGASQVIYVLIDGFQLSPEPNLYRPTAAARVKVIDVGTGKRVYPAGDPAGHPVTAKMYYKFQQEISRGSDQMLGRRLVDRLGSDIALLFYEHKEREIGSDFDE